MNGSLDFTGQHTFVLVLAGVELVEVESALATRRE